MLIGMLGLERARLVCLCGAGGKTSLLFALAGCFAARGERVLVTTTTKLAAHETELAPRGVTLSHAGRTADGQKVLGHPPERIDELKAAGSFDRLLVEADGAARRPLKAPAGHEPVVPTTTDAVVVVAGMSGLGRPLAEDTVFRADLWASLSGTRLGAPVNPESFARVAVHAEGLAKGCPAGAHAVLLLNQAETAAARATAVAIARLIASSRSPFHRVLSGRLQPSPQVVAL